MARESDPIQYKSTDLQLEYFWSNFIKVDSYKNLTSIEIEEIKPDAEAFIKPDFDIENWNTENLESFIHALHPPSKFTENPDETEPHGSPFIMVVTRSALRAVQLVKFLMPFRKFAHIGTLFAKHKQIENQMKFLSEWHCKLAIGTPNRMLALAENGALRFDLLSHLIIDMDRDIKSLSILDLKDCQGDFYNLYAKYIHKKVKERQTKIAFF